MNKISGYIVDDENLARYSLRKKLSEIPEIDIIGEACNIDDAAKEICELNPDVLFLDIQLKEGTGFDLLNQIEYKGKVVFITAFDMYAIRAFEINAIDYLLKPISNKRLRQAIDRVLEPQSIRRRSNISRLEYSDRFMVTSNQFINFINISDIVIIKSSGDYSELTMKDGKLYLVSRPMIQWEQSLPENNFCRISRFYIVNLNYVIRIKKIFTIPGLLYIEGHEEPLKISKSYYQKLKLKYK